MTSVVKNIIILFAFIVFFNWLSMAEAYDDYEKMFYRTIPDSWMINYTPVEKCVMRNWKWCLVA